MENQNVHYNQIKQAKKISKLSLISFFILIFSYVILGIDLIFWGKISFISIVWPLVLAICNISSFAMSIIDLIKGQRKKWLSITTIILSSLYFLFFITAIIFIILYAKLG